MLFNTNALYKTTKNKEMSDENSAVQQGTRNYKRLKKAEKKQGAV